MKKIKARRFDKGIVCELSDLCVGKRAIVVQINEHNQVFRRKLFDMGITKGVLLEVRKKAPLGDPISVKLRGYELCLRISDLKKISVRVV